MSTSTKLMFAGGLGVGVGVALAAGFKAANNEADKFFRLQKDIINNGAKASQTAAITAWAKTDDPRLRTLSINDKMEVGKEAFALTRDAGRDDVHHTLKLAPILAQMEASDKARGVHTSEAQRQAFVKALEMSGGFNDGVDTEKRADLLFKVMQSGGGTLKATQIASVMKNDPADMQKVSDGFLMRAEPLMQQMGGTFSVSLRTLESRLLAHVGLGGKPNLGKFKELIDIGALDKGGKVIDADTLVYNPDRWVQKHMPEFYARAGAKNDADRRQVDQLIGNTGGAKFLAGALREQTLMDASEVAIRRQHGITQSADEVGGPKAKQNAIMRAQVADLEERIGETSLPLFVRGLTFLNSGLIRLNKWMSDNPGKLRIVVEGLVKFAAALIVIGASSFVLGFIGKLVGLLRFIGRAFMLLVRFGGMLFTALRFLFLVFVDIVGWPIALATALIAAGIAIYTFRDKIADVFSGLWGWIKAGIPDWAKKAFGVGDGAAPGSAPAGVGAMDAPAVSLPPKESPSIKTGANRPFKVDANLFLTKAGLHHIANGTGEHLARGASMPLGSGMFDSGLTQTVPGLN